MIVAQLRGARFEVRYPAKVVPQPEYRNRLTIEQALEDCATQVVGHFDDVIGKYLEYLTLYGKRTRAKFADGEE